jgi:hypothetical protein
MVSSPKGVMGSIIREIRKLARERQINVVGSGSWIVIVPPQILRRAAYRGHKQAEQEIEG